MPAISPRHHAFGKAIRMLRDERGLTQEALAGVSGLTTNYVGDTERGERNIGIRSVWQLADGLGIPASELLREAERQAQQAAS